MKKTFKVLLVMMLCVLTLSATLMSASAAAGPTVRVKSVATNSVTIYWTKASGISITYDIQRTTNGKTWTTLATGVKTTEYTDSKGLTTGVSYGYRVRSKGLTSLSYSDWSAMAVGKPLPAKVTGFKLNSATHQSVQLTWTKVAGASGYTVQYHNGSTWVTYKSLTANSLTISGLKLGSSYNFRVAAVKVVSGKWIYGPVSDTLKAGPVLGVTGKVALTGLDSTRLRVAWLAVAGAKGYKILNHNTGEWTDVGNKTSILLTGFKPAEKCSFTVKAYAGSLEGKESKKVTFKTAPTVPVNLGVVDATSSSITFKWDAVEGADGYQPCYYNFAKGAWINLPLTKGTTATVTGLGSLAQCGFRVRAYIQNSDVYGISTYATSAWAPYIISRSVLPATKLATVRSTVDTDTLIKWNRLANATGYCVEKYSPDFKEWTVYDFTSSSWLSYDQLDDESNIVTTALNFTDRGKTTRSDVYRVRAIDKYGNKGTFSNLITAFTKDVLLNTSASTFVIQQQLSWYATEGAAKYQILVRDPVTSNRTLAEPTAASITSGGICKLNMYLAHNSIHSVMIIAYDSNDRVLDTSRWITFNVGATPVLSTTHGYYNASINSHLNYLAQAINNTKAYQEPITVNNKSTISLKIMFLRMPLFPLFNMNSPEEVEAFFKKYDESGDLPVNTTETFTSTLTFDEGKAVNDDGRTVRLKSFVEPSSNSTQSAYLHNSQNYNAWRNAFDSVTVQKSANGDYTMKLNFKQEKGSSPYHDGFLSSFSSSDFTEGSGFAIKDLIVGKSTLTAVIDKDGYLKSYKTSSPYSATFCASFTAEEDVEDEDVDIEAGQLVAMEMGVQGSTAFDYTFTR